MRFVFKRRLHLAVSGVGRHRTRRYTPPHRGHRAVRQPVRRERVAPTMVAPEPNEIYGSAQLRGRTNWLLRPLRQRLQLISGITLPKRMKYPRARRTVGAELRELVEIMLMAGRRDGHQHACRHLRRIGDVAPTAFAVYEQKNR